MFGYVVPDKPYLLIKDYALYKCIYCGICVSTKKYYGNLPRFLTNYDSVFLSALAHNCLNTDYNIERHTCVLSPFKRKGMAMPDELTKKIVTVNILLSYQKLTDDIIDGGGLFKRAARALIVKRAYKKAKKFMPEAGDIIRRKYERLRQFEKNGEKSLDRVSDCFASMMEKLCGQIFGDKATPQMEHLFYNIGKWIYLADALDDLEKDKKTGNYNPLVAAYGGFDDVKAYKESIRDKMRFTFNCIFDSIRNDFDSAQFYFNTDILRNIMFRGLENRTNMLMENTKCKKTRI